MVNFKKQRKTGKFLNSVILVLNCIRVGLIARNKFAYIRYSKNNLVIIKFLLKNDLIINWIICDRWQNMKIKKPDEVKKPWLVDDGNLYDKLIRVQLSYFKGGPVMSSIKLCASKAKPLHLTYKKCIDLQKHQYNFKWVFITNDGLMFLDDVVHKKKTGNLLFKFKRIKC